MIVVDGNDTWVRVGRVGRAHGLKGAFVVDEASEDPERFEVGAIVHVGRQPARVVTSKLAGGRPVIQLDVESRQGDWLEVRASELPSPEDEEYYVFQLVGLRVEEVGGRLLGTVKDVTPGIANDVLELDSGELLPMVDECVQTIDLDAGRIVVAAGFVL